MKTSDYIVQFLISRGITDVFGYPGGMVTHLMDSLERFRNEISAHVTYHEQAAAFAACAYAQVSEKPGVAYATSGPGATNLITGICNAYFDSVPVIFLTGQVNTFEAKGERQIRQRGFQETDIISMVRHVTKYAVCVERAGEIRYHLERAYAEAMKGRKGPVLLDLPMNVIRSEINPGELEGYNNPGEQPEHYSHFIDTISEALRRAKRPCILLGNGVKSAGMCKECRKLAGQCGIPVVSSMLAVDILPRSEDTGSGYYYGFIGAYGTRTANFILAKCDLVIVLGSRLDIRQTGADRENFAPGAALIRIDIDPGEAGYQVRQDETVFLMDLKEAIPKLLAIEPDPGRYQRWNEICRIIRSKLEKVDEREPDRYMEALGRLIPDHRMITTDVGQNQVWTAQSFRTGPNQQILFSGGHGAMGYALPAAIGAYYGGKMPVICMSGDGGFQMNLQELQFVAREQLPVKIILWNNGALGMIRHFQEMYFDNRYAQTVPRGGYTVPDFCTIAQAYGIKSCLISRQEELEQIDFEDGEPELIEIRLTGKTYVYPKLEYGKPGQDQEPLLDRRLYDYLMDL